jgi:hypothetical protein
MCNYEDKPTGDTSTPPDCFVSDSMKDDIQSEKKEVEGKRWEDHL